MHLRRAWQASTAAVLLLAALGPSPARAAAERDVPLDFFVSKSENRNQVHYAVKVDDACRPVSPAPVRAYWRMLEKGPKVTEPLLDREKPAYGIGSQTVEGMTVRIALRALPARPIVIRTWRGADGACLLAATTTIAGVRARLFNVHLVLRMFGVAYVLMTGWRDDGTVVRERINP